MKLAVRESKFMNYRFLEFITGLSEGSGGGSVGRAVAYDTRELRFESQDRQNDIYQLYI